MKHLTLERAEAYEVSCPFTGAGFKVQFWDTHQQDSYGKRRMAYAVGVNSPTFPSQYSLMAHGSQFYPAPSISCDGPEAAAHLLGLILNLNCGHNSAPLEGSGVVSATQLSVYPALNLAGTSTSESRP